MKSGESVLVPRIEAAGGQTRGLESRSLPATCVSRRVRHYLSCRVRLRGTRHLRGEITFTRPRGQIALRQADGEVVHLAVELLRRETERVLMMELVGDAREGRRKISGRRQLEVAAAGGRRDLRQPFVGLLHLRAAAAVPAHAAPAEATDASRSHGAAAAPVAAAGDARHAVLTGEPDRV